MRPNRLTVPLNHDRSFDIRHEIVPYFNNPWHFHPELELNYVVASSGTRFIGNNIEKFEGGEIILLGKHLSHYWKNDQQFLQPECLQKPEAIVVRFAEDFAGKGFFLIPETQVIQRLFEKARGGLKLHEPLRSRVADALHALIAQEGFRQLMLFLDILHEIGSSEQMTVISPDYRPSALLTKNNEKLGKIYAYLLEHFTEQISLTRVAEIASMNEAAFCRYFKSQTGRTFTHYLTDLRIRYACDLLCKKDTSVTEVCYEIGFENVSHFIQVFKKQMGQTPFEFRKGML
ncbi:HTH-type transcriptional activator RhaS [Dyadobacter sp. CECT 9275]|uniref:HTH-type transcriptional activator RhaS n=1 Tax=Dyadobacter helix TaxID=2822344 RepID=A0A916JCK0_9BACT|nr:AraC family transcriptional regulator [Dyadobacter sp. CECT 9275]CAG5000197.1 HTH-type transcriptional activator RhaS [Dyadobacter sp. CECT 9275]